MITLSAKNMGFEEINRKIRENGNEFQITDLLGQRFIAAGMSDKDITLIGTPGNALCSYLNGANVTVYGNAQDAVGDTMNDGKIVIHGNIGDAAGYAMRGGKIFVKGNLGYRGGIHMKAYNEKVPALVVGGTAGSFLGEYQAGGRTRVKRQSANSRKLPLYGYARRKNAAPLRLQKRYIPE